MTMIQVIKKGIGTPIYELIVTCGALNSFLLKIDKTCWRNRNEIILLIHNNNNNYYNN